MLVIDERDNVSVQTTGPQAGHKFARCEIACGQPVIKYGYPIGFATCDIAKGEWVHSHNLKTGLGEILDYTYCPVSVPSVKGTDSFRGYLRSDGRVGIRNEIWIIPTVGCVNDTAKALARRCGAYAFCHPYGCSQLGQDHENTQRALAALIKHPNAGGVLVLGLGCENNRIESLKQVLGDYDPERVRFLEAQSVEDELAQGERFIDELKARVAQDRRTRHPVSKLVVGLKCGGSDGFSGITANPLVGMFSDQLIQNGGSTILTEVPEMFGAETILMNRCKDQQTFEKTVEMINRFKKYYQDSGQPIYENPSPGNKDGGITTLEEKSLGCIRKSGHCAVNDVLGYGQPVMHTGLNLLNAPGNDLIASTALAVSGAQIVLFTTGRGTPFGCPVPTLKIATNTPLARKKQSWIDFNAGVLLEDAMEATARQLYQFVKEVANGERSNQKRDQRF